jgi:hypothetical protein
VTQFEAVVEYLRHHWKNCKMLPGERRADINYYRELGDPYGDVFADKLLTVMEREINGG